MILQRMQVAGSGVVTVHPLVVRDLGSVTNAVKELKCNLMTPFAVWAVVNLRTSV